VSVIALGKSETGREKTKADEGIRQHEVAGVARFTRKTPVFIGVSQKQPPGLIEFAFDDRILAFASAYFVTVPMLSYAKVRKSFINAIPPSPTQRFHVDIGTYSLFKVLLYLHDVEPGGGPFCYVLGSHRKRFAGWQAKRYSREEMAQTCGDDRVVRFHARAGDAIVVESAGFHGGEKPAAHDRNILILNYTVHPEYGFEYPPVRMRRSDFDGLSAYAKAVADHVEIVG
jgi:hypothetical protein